MDDHGLARTTISPEGWRHWVPRSLPAPKTYKLDRAQMQRWSHTHPVMEQPPLDHHLIVLHEGGPKRVVRSGPFGSVRSVDVELHATSTVESGSAYRWQTEGPIAFTHIYVSPERFTELVERVFDRTGRVGFAETIGREDPFVTQIIQHMIACRNDADWPLVGEYYLDALLVRLASISSSGEFPLPPRIALTPRTVSRVRDYMRANLHARISLDDLAEVAGYSRYHFVRAFKHSTGLPPYTYLLSERIASAKQLLRTTDLPIAEIAALVGFATHAQFSSRFREITGATPASFRRRMDEQRRRSDSN